MNKFKKNGVCYTQKKNNIFSFYKNGVHYEIEIIQLFDNGDDFGDGEKKRCNVDIKCPIFYYKIIQKKGGLNMNKFFSSLILSP